jgi:hypothetical protein
MIRIAETKGIVSYLPVRFAAYSVNFLNKNSFSNGLINATPLCSNPERRNHECRSGAGAFLFNSSRPKNSSPSPKIVDATG